MAAARQRVALVTGSSRGLGSAIVRRLARDRLAVAVNDLSGDSRALELVREIRDEGELADAFPADVTDERQAADLVAAVTEGLGALDVLVLNATGPQPEAPLAEVGWEDHLAQLEFFVKSPVLLGRAALPGMREAGWGRIIHVVSVPAGRMGTREDIAHAVSFFASEAAGFVTDQRLVVDGGRARRLIARRRRRCVRAAGRGRARCRPGPRTAR